MLSQLLPVPKHNYNQIDDNIQVDTNTNISSTSTKKKGFVPIDVEDFNDGGAYPELHVVQYPLNMGKPGVKSTALVAVQVDEAGKIRTDMIVKQGSNRNKMIQSQISDIKEKISDKDLITLPEEKEIVVTAEKTRLALESLISSKIASAKPSTVVNTNEIPDPTYIRYTPNPNAPGYNDGAKQRVIKMVEAQIDPMEPPKHKHTKAPRGPPSPPVPILHSPPRKITVADQQAWKVPPCVSNWKNARGFIIPLDKRLAADGRGLQEVTINNKFATVSEALFIAERKATEDLKIRNDIRKKMALREKEEREMALRDMANRARMERAGVRVDDEEEVEEDYGLLEERKNRFSTNSQISNSNINDDRYNDNDEDEDIEEFHGESEQDQIARQQRERIRMERRKERERELRLDNMKGNMRKNKIDRDEGRDISEKIALGMLKGAGGKLTGESLYDGRLFNQTSGMDAGFGNEDEYNTYTKPLFDRPDGTNSIYRPKQNAEDIYGDAEKQLKDLSDTSRFKADKGFKGTETSYNSKSGGGTKRDVPVQFEKASTTSSNQQVQQQYHHDEEEESSRRHYKVADPFGINDIVDDDSRNKRSRRD